MNRDELHRRAVHAVASRRDRRLFRAMRRVARSYLDLDGNLSYDPHRNGEERVLRILGPGARCLFDVGANVGDWTLLAARHAPQAELHAFELVPPTAERLAARVGDHPRVHVNEVGLSDAEGEVQVRFYPRSTELSSMVTAFGGDDFEWRTARTTTGDRYCDEHAIDRIDLLKIDVEGAEQLVLRGFEQRLRSGAVAAIQFEYGQANALTGVLMRDFYEHLGTRGFRLGKIFPTSVAFAPYAVATHEDFRGPNVLAVHESRQDLLRALAGTA